MFQVVPLRDICESVDYGFTASASKEAIGPNFLRITDIAGEALEWSTVPYCEIESDKLDKYRLRTGDIVIARTGATTGWAKYIKNPPDSVFASYLVRIRLKSDVDARFVGFVVESQVYKDFIQQHLGGAAQPNANAQVLTSYKIPLPPLAVQNRFAGILSAYDDLIENCRQRIKILEQMARGLYHEWFVNFRYPNHAKTPMVDSPLGKIPKGWEVKSVGDIAEEMRRAVPKGELDAPQAYVGLEHIPRRALALDNWETVSELGSNKLLFKRGEVLFGKIRPYFHKVSVAPFDGVCSADTIVLRPYREEHGALMIAVVASDDFVAHATATSNGSKMPRANWSVVEKYPILLPDEKLLGQFSALFSNSVSEQQSLVFRIQNLRKTRDLLLPRLMSGQLNVN